VGREAQEVKRIHKTLLTAAILFGGGVGVGLYILKTDVRTPEERFADQVRKERLFPEEFGIAHVKSGELMTRGTTIAFARDAGGWKITAPVEWPADAQAIADAINQMVGVKIDPESRVESPDAKQLATWGLIKPRIRLSLDTERGKFSLLVGPKNSIREMFPITDGAHRAGGLARPDFHWALDRSLSELRDRRVFPFPPEQIQSVRTSAFVLERSGDVFTVSDADGKNSEPADLDRAELYLVALTKRLKIGRFLDDESTGAEAPTLLEVTSKEGAKVTANVGKIYETGDQKGTAVMHLAGTKTVVEVPDYMHEEMAKTKDDLKDRTVLRIERKKVAKVELEYAGQKAVVEKRGEDWTVGKDPALGYMIDNIVRVFGRLKAERFHTMNASPRELERWLLDPPSRRLAFYGPAGELLGEVRIGNRFAEKEFFAMNSAEKRVAILKEDLIGKVLPAKLEDLIDRR
jgi:hypothetical protein